MQKAAPETRDFLRHVLATVAYRGAKALRNAPDTFADFKAGEKTRTPGQILAHMGDLLEWSVRLSRGGMSWREAWQPQAHRTWESDVDRFFAAVKSLDDYLGSDSPMATSGEVLFQGPISDALTHVGQLAMLRGLAGSRVRGEVMIIADVVVGRVGLDQSAPAREFD